MNLVLEIGNTTTKFAIFEKENLIELVLFENEKIDLIKIKSMNFDKAIIAGSGKIDLKILDEINATEKIIFDKSFITNIKINYQTPNTLGQDRLINANYAATLFPNKNNLIIDVGTCITFTFINTKHELIGGSISPGLKLRAKSLNDYTENLPLISPNQDSTSKLIGQNTTESIESGVILGTILEIERRIEQYLAEYPDLSIIMTGGDTLFFENKIKYRIFANPSFTLQGLNYLLNVKWNKNRTII